MTVRVRGILLAAGAVLLPAPARAHHYRLQAGGFEGLALAPDPVQPATLYAGVFGQGVIKTTDTGETWTGSSTGLPDLAVRALLVDPADLRRLFAGTDSGVAVSTGGGRQWREAGLSARAERVLLGEPAGTLYAGTEDGLYATDDAGRT